MNIKSSIGYSPTIPPMLNNSRDIMNAKQNMKKVKNMMVAVTASWCGACHNISDDLNKAIRDPNNTSPGTRIDEKMLGKFNRVLKTPIEPPHFPYFIVIDEQGQLKEVLETMDAVKQFLKSSGSASRMASPPMVPVPNASNMSASTGKPASPVNTIVPSYVPSATPEDESDDESDVPNGANLSILSNESGMPTGIVSKSMTNGEQGLPMSLTPKKSSTNSSTASMINSAISASVPVPSVMKMSPVPISNALGVGKGASANMKSAVPPSRESDALTPMGTSTPSSLSNSQKGGYLYESLAAAAYQLAPPAVLMGIAAATLRKRRGRKAKKTQRGRR
jgi:hypothetical protein